MAQMTVNELRVYTQRNHFDTIIINGKPKAEYAARQFLFGITDQSMIIETKIENEMLVLKYLTTCEAECRL